MVTGLKMKRGKDKQVEERGRGKLLNQRKVLDKVDDIIAFLSR